MTQRPSGDSPGDGRTIAAPGRFANDDGSPDWAIRQAEEVAELLQSLRRGRLLVAVTSVATEVDSTGGDKESDMAVISMVTSDGRRGLLAFTGLDSFRAWDRSARPVPVTGVDAAVAALDDGCEALIVDVAGPRPRVVIESDLLALADRAPIDHACALASTRLAEEFAQGQVRVDVVGGMLHVTCPASICEQVAGVLQSAPRILALVPAGIRVQPGQ